MQDPRKRMACIGVNWMLSPFNNEKKILMGGLNVNKPVDTTFVLRMVRMS